MASTQEQRDQYLGLVVAGWIFTFHLPVAGIICGFFLVNRRDGHALAMIAFALLELLALFLLVVLPYSTT